MYKGSLTFRYYQYEPNCIKFTNWNGTDCAPDFESYCKSLTSTFINEIETPDLRVYYNGTNCVVGPKVYANITLPYGLNMS